LFFEDKDGNSEWWEIGEVEALINIPQVNIIIILMMENYLLNSLLMIATINIMKQIFTMQM
jgi:hypothetical protein